MSEPIFFEDFNGFKKAVLEAIDKHRAEIERLFKAYEEFISNGWEVLKPAKPVSKQDPAIRWLFKTLKEVKNKHRNIKYFFVERDGLILALKYRVENSEQEKDLVNPAKWAFEKAANR